jgi:DNA gyrase subunit A
VARVNQLLHEKKLPGVARVLNLTDRKGTRLVVEFKTGFSPKAVLADLYRTTPLEESFSINTIALVDGRPRTLTCWSCASCTWITASTWSPPHPPPARQGQARAHIVEGLIIALDAIDEVVAIIRASKTAEAARRS